MKRIIHQRIQALLLALVMAGTAVLNAPVTISAEEAVTEAVTEAAAEAVTETPQEETAAPETAAPETAAPETAAPETAAAETTAAETAAAVTTEPETAAPETQGPTDPAGETEAPITDARGPETEKGKEAEETETESEEAAYPAVIFRDILTEDGILLTVEAPEGALPEGVRAAVEKVDLRENGKDPERAAKILKKLSDAVYPDSEETVEPEQAAALDIWFYLEETGRDVHVQPEKPVKLTFRDVKVEGDLLYVYHIADKKETDTEEPKARLVSRAPVTNPQEGKAVLEIDEAKDFSVYAVVGKVLAEAETEEEETESEIRPETQETQAEAETEEPGTEPETGDLTRIYEGNVTPEELAENEEEEAEATTVWTDPKAAPLSERILRYVEAVMGKAPWSFDAYYVNVENKYDITRTDDFKLKYQMEFHTSTDILAGDMAVKIPKVLLVNRSGKGITPDDIGVPYGTPEEPVSTNVTPLNYYEDEEGNLVFFNYRDMLAGTNCAWQVLYKSVNVLEIVDMSTWSLQPHVSVTVLVADEEEPSSEEPSSEETSDTEPAQPEASGQVFEVQELDSTPLTGLVDTQATLTGAVKKAYSDSGVSYTPGLYTEKQIKKYVPDARVPEDFGKYRYSIWEITASGYNTQYWDLYLDDKAFIDQETEGTIIGISGGILVTEGEYAGQYRIASCGGSRSVSARTYVVTAFPADKVKANETVFHNEAVLTLVPRDGIDEPQQRPVSAQWTYKDYVWKYGGDTIGIRKSGNGTLTGWTTAFFDYLAPNGADLGGLSYSVSAECKNFGLTHQIVSGGEKTLGEYLDGKYVTITTVDDALYAIPNDGSKAGTVYLLDKDDYYFSSVTVTQSDTGYDVWEDTSSSILVPVEETGDLDRGLRVYAWFEDGDDWEEVTVVPWDGRGTLTYTFTEEDIARHPWRVKMVHNAVDYSSNGSMNLGVTIKADSPVFKEFSDASIVQVHNVDGTFGTDQDGEYFHDGSIHDRNYEEEGLVDLSMRLYGILPMRDGATVQLTPIARHAQAQKYASATNDPANGRVNIRYTVSGYEGYTAYSQQLIDLVKEDEKYLSPARNSVVISDLLPYGVEFDATVPVTAGRLKGLDGSNLSNRNYWAKEQVSVSDISITPNWRGTGRTKVDFTLRYDGAADPSIYSGGRWFGGYGVYFGAYVTWREYDNARRAPNVAAYMLPAGDPSPMIGEEGEVSKDDGDPQVSGGDPAPYKVFGSDINDDGVTDVRHVLFARASVNDDIAVASESGIQKKVKADSDELSPFEDSTVVAAGENYTYSIAVTNTSDKDLTDIVVFDRLEYAWHDRVEEEPTVDFDQERHWQGTFRGLGTQELASKGITPIVYYSADREAPLPSGDEDARSFLAESPEWVRADNWAGDDLSQVKAIALDLRKASDGTSYVLPGDIGSLSFRVMMTAPTNQDQAIRDGAVWAYNNPSFSSLALHRGDGEEDVRGFTAGNSVKVKIDKNQELEIEKEFLGDVPDSRANEEFEFTLTRTSAYTEGARTAYANKEYSLYKKGSDGSWEKQSGKYATDAQGRLYLRAGEKAVFASVADADDIQAEETWDPHWLSEQTEEKREDGAGKRILVNNTFRPLLYLSKTLDGYVKTGESEAALKEQEFFFRVTVNGEPAKNADCYVYDQKPSEGTYRKYKEVRVTDENGLVMLHGGEAILLTPGLLGDTFRVEEPAELLGDDWVCQRNNGDGILSEKDSSVTITNYYKWKDLNIRKKTEQYDGEEDPEFTFRIWELPEEEEDSGDTETGPEGYGALVTDLEWELSAIGEEEPLTGTIGEDGLITAACAGRVLTVHGLETQKTYLVEEVLDEEQSRIWRPENSGLAEAAMPLYSTQKSVTITNYYLPRDLSVSKSVLYNEANQDTADLLNEKSFRMVLELKEGEGDEFTPAGGKSYVLLDKNGEPIETEETLATGEDGSFLLMEGQTAFFEGIANEGAYWRAAEEQDEDFPQVFPLEKAPLEGQFAQGVSRGEFINGSTDILIIRKDYVAEEGAKLGDAALEAARDLALEFTVEIQKGEGEEYQPLSTETDFEVIRLVTPKDPSESGTMESVTVEDGRLPMDGRTTYIVIPTESAGDAFRQWNYRVQETAVSDGRGGMKDGVSGWYRYSEADGAGGDGRENAASRTGYLIMNNAAEEISQENIWEVQNLVVLENKLDSFVPDSRIYKIMRGGSAAPAAGSRITFRLKRYENGAWVPASDVRYAINFSDKNVMEKEDEVFGFTGTDGLITYEADGGTDKFYIVFEGHVLIDDIGQSADRLNEGYTLEDCLLIEEVRELTDDDWGQLLGYGTSASKYRSLSSDYGSGSNTAEYYNAFVNTNTYEYIEIAKEVNIASGKYFTFRLERVFQTFYNKAKVVPGSNLEYTVYGPDNQVVSTGRTTAEGKFSIQGGQYVRILVPEGSRWKVTEESPYPYTLEGIRYGEEGTPVDMGSEVNIRAPEKNSGALYSYRFRSAVNNNISVRHIIFGWTKDYAGAVAGTEGKIIDSTNSGSIMLYQVGDTVYVLSDEKIVLLDGCWMFQDYYNVETIQFENLDTSECQDFQGMFEDCRSLTSLDLSGWDMSNARYLYNMFYNCSSLTSVDLTGWDMSNAYNLAYMFQGCSSLTSVDLTGWDMSNAYYLYGMFRDCSSLTSLDLSGWDMSKACDLYYMFSNCSSLTSLDLSGWDMSNAYSSASMFYNCSSLTSLDLSGWDMSNAYRLDYMFYDCSGLTSLDLSGWDMSKACDLYYMFRDCSSLTSVDLTGWDMSNAYNLAYMFQGCSSLTSLDLTGWDMSNAYYLYSMFSNCSSLRSLDLSGWDMSNARYLYNMFQNCSSLETIYASDWTARSCYNITGQNAVFSGCSKLSGYSSSKTSGAYCKPISAGGYFSTK